MAQQPGAPSQWISLLGGTVLAPAVLGAFIVGAVNVYTTNITERDKEHSYQVAFVDLVNNKIVTNEVFAKTGDLPDAQRAAVTLLTLRSLADSESERESVLLLTARLMAINPNPQTSEPAARVLTLFVQEIDNDLRQGRDAAVNQRLHDLTRSRAFMDLATSGITKTYYNDNPNIERKYWSTLNGDEPVDRPAMAEAIEQIGPGADAVDGWVNLATYGTSYDFPKATGPATATLTPTVADDFITATAAVSSGDLGRGGSVRSQYAIEAPIGSKLPTRQLIDVGRWRSVQHGLLMLGPRYLRSDAPVVFINPDGTFREGTLGRVIGAVPAATCVDIVEPVRYVIVFVDSAYLANEQGRDQWAGLIHVWAHVRTSQQGCSFASEVPGGPGG